MSACFVLIGVLCAPALCQPSSEGVSDALGIDCAFLRKHGKGSGTAYLFLRNVGKKAVLITALELDGYRVPITNAPQEARADYEKAREAAMEKEKESVLKVDRFAVAAQRILWSKIEPNPVPAGEIAAVTIRLAQRFTRPFTITVSGTERTADGYLGARTAISRKLLPVSAPITIESVGFSSSKGSAVPNAFDRMYLYLCLRGANGVQPTKVTINGTDLTGNSRFLEVPELTSDQGGNSTDGRRATRWVVAIGLQTPVAQGRPMVAMVEATRKGATERNPLITACRVRAFSHFPVSTESPSRHADDLHLDPVPFSGSYARDRKAIQERTIGSPGPLDRDYQILHCPTHVYGARFRRSAHEIILRSCALFAQDPHNASSVHLCRLRPIEGAAAFGELSDIIRVNAGVLPQTFRSGAKEQHRRQHFSQYLIGEMRKAAGPATSVHAVVPAGQYEKRKMIAAEHLRLCVISALSSGARGILYRGPAWSRQGDQFRKLVSRTNQEAQLLKPLLRFAHPLPLAQTADKEVEAVALLAGDRAIVVIALNHAVDPVQGDLGKFLASAQKDVAVSVLAPAWLRPGTAYEVCGLERKPLEIAKRGRTLEFSIRELGTAKAFVILSSAEGDLTVPK